MDIKGTQAWDSFVFFLAWIKTYMTKVNIKKNWFFTFDFPRISMFEHFLLFSMTEQTQNQFFVARYKYEFF